MRRYYVTCSKLGLSFHFTGFYVFKWFKENFNKEAKKSRFILSIIGEKSSLGRSNVISL